MTAKRKTEAQLATRLPPVEYFDSLKMKTNEIPPARKYRSYRRGFNDAVEAIKSTLLSGAATPAPTAALPVTPNYVSDVIKRVSDLRDHVRSMDSGCGEGKLLAEVVALLSTRAMPSAWRPISEYKRQRNCVFRYKPVSEQRNHLPSLIHVEGPNYGYRECTHFFELPKEPTP